MNKDKFNKIVEEGIARGRDFMAVKIETAGNPGFEIIINPKENFTAKARYYDKNYNENMELIKAKEAGKIIRIVDVLFTSNFNDLSWFAY